MDGIVIAGNVSEFNDIGLGHDVLVGIGHADREILESVAGAVLPTGANVVHATLQSQGTCSASTCPWRHLLHRKLTAQDGTCKPMLALSR
jgi:hypothetical protein